jgi:alkylhydroperoxidase family enzyme
MATLGTPKLNPVEAVVVPLAREMVWYQPSQIQRRARQVREALSKQEFLELIVVVAIANAVERFES